jgi:hypothetical protein
MACRLKPCAQWLSRFAPFCLNETTAMGKLSVGSDHTDLNSQPDLHERPDLTLLQAPAAETMLYPAVMVMPRRAQWE